MSGRRELRLAAAGVELRALVEGAGEPLLVLHGFTGRAESMEPVAAGLRDTFTVVRLDLLGHGESEAPRDPAPYAMERCIAQVTAALDALGIRRAHALGYSMGGRVALALAARQPGRVGSAVLVGASAGLAAPDARAARVRSDEALADRIEREGIERFVDAWMALPLFASQARLGPAFLARARAERLAARPHGLANSLRGMGSGAQPPLHAELARVGAPVLLAVGSLDAKFEAIARELAAALPDARVHPIPDAGHACHLEQNESFLRTVRAFLADVTAGPRARASASPEFPKPNPQPGVPRT